MKQKNATRKQTPHPSAPADRREVEERLSRSEERYRRIFENIQDIYYEVGIDGTMLEISPSSERYSTFRREEPIGRSLNAFYADKTKITQKSTGFCALENLTWLNFSETYGSALK
jgi:PAS domain-containing protein